MKNLIKFTYTALLLLLLPALSFPQSSLEVRLDSLLSDSMFKSTLASVNVYDLTAKKPLYEKNIKILLKPASNLKIVTTSAGLCFLGPEYKFQTLLYYTGSIKDSVCTGDIFVKGNGDPDFGLADLDTLVSMVKQSGIREIKGHIYADVSYMDSLFWGKGWMWDDDPSTDAPYLSALNINSNTVTVNIKPGLPGNPVNAATVPETPFFRIVNRSYTVPKGDSSTFRWDRDWLHRNNDIVLKGNLPENSSPITEDINVYDPARYFLTLFKERLEKAHVLVLGTIDTAGLPQNAKLIYTFGRPYGEVIVNLNKTSDNLSAEMTLRAMANKFFGKPSTPENGIKIVDSLLTLAGLNYKDYRIVDGSGVSHYNLVTTELLVELLKYMYYSRPELFGILYNSFPIAGVDGSLEYRMKDTEASNNLHAKTGTLSGVSSLSGYVTSRNKHMLVFSSMIENYVGSSSKAVRVLDEIGRILAESAEGTAAE